jgi:hypothetical protein
MLQPRANISQEEYCPVSDDVLGQLYRAAPHGLEELIASVPAEIRAVLAIYCYRRAHLQAIGLTIATSCEELDLRKWGGFAGTVLFEKSRASGRVMQPTYYQERRKVTLSTGLLKPVVQDEADEDAQESSELGGILVPT